MKHNRILTLSIFFIAFLLFSCSSNDDNEIENQIVYEDLPSLSQTFIEEYFGGKENVEKIEKEEEDNLILYDVDLKDGYEIIFNAQGYWQEIDAPSGKTINPAVLPEPIVATLNYQYHSYGVVAINTTGENYHVVLSNNQGGDSIDLIFNQSGEILSTSTN